MTFTIASAAREALTALIVDRARREKEEDDRKTREYEEVSYGNLGDMGIDQTANGQAEAERTRGTPVTHDSFDQWRQRFTAELRVKREREEDERVKALPTREREDYRRKRERASGVWCSLS